MEHAMIVMLDRRAGLARTIVEEFSKGVTLEISPTSKPLSPLRLSMAQFRTALAGAYAEVVGDRVMTVAGAVAFFGLLAFVPAISVLVAMTAAFGDPATIGKSLKPLLSVMPQDAQLLVNSQIERLAQSPARTLSWPLILSLLLAIWSASAGMRALFNTLNIIHGEAEKRSFLHFNLIAILITIGAVMVLAMMVLFAGILPNLVAYLPILAEAEGTVELLRWPVLIIITTGALIILFRIGPSRKPPPLIWQLPGALIAALIWSIFSETFGYYVVELGNYSRTYGALAAVVVFMTWLWLSAAIVLIGAVINGQLEKAAGLHQPAI
jgi:membrane protein